PPHFLDQLSLYANIVYNAPGLTDERLLEFYKDASFGVRDDDIDRVYSPTANVTVIRDKSFGVPHIFGDTRYATMFAQAYTGAEGMSGYLDLVAYTDGVNQYINEALMDPSKMPAEYPALQQTPATWKVEDAVAIASLVGGIFGKGGGGELTNFCGLKAMTAA